MNQSYLSSERVTALSLKPSTTIRLLLMVLFVSITPLVSFGQCGYPAGATSVGTYTFCIDNTNTITTATVNDGQYALLNVIKGFQYTFSVGNAWTGGGNNENLTVFDASSNVSLTGNNGDNGCSISWTSTISGQVKILLSKNCVFGGSAGRALTLTTSPGGNTQDSQTTYGTDTWIGHIYNYPGYPLPGTLDPFITANYAGNYTVGTETINENFGGNTACFPVFSNGIQRASIYKEQFAVRYHMQSTKAGYYFMNADADDGIRATVDGVTVISNWKNNSDTQYCNNLIYLNGSSDIIVDYYEDFGYNVVGVNFAAITGNSISSYADINVCSGVSPGLLDGSSILSCTGGTTNTTYNTTYQWQSSTDNVTFTNISGATAEDYTPTAVTTATVNVTYYRRVLKAFAVPITGLNPATGSVKVITNSAPPATPGAITGSATQCAGNTLQTYSVAAVANATSYNWTLPTNWTITAGAGTNSITVSIASNGATDNVSVNAVNACGIGYASSEGGYKWVTVTNITPTGAAAQSFCSGATVANLSASGTTIQWYAASSGGSPLATTTALVNATHYYATQTVSGCGESTTRFDVTATVTAIPSAPTIGTITQPTCSIATGSVVLNSLPAGNWMLTTSPGSVTTLGSGISTTIAGLAAGTTYTYLVNNLNNGLKGEYFNTMNLTGSPVLTRTDATVNFDWSYGSPDSSINVDNFSVRWSGVIQAPVSGTYTFSTNSDDGIRLWVNGVLVIDNWTVHAATINTGTIALTAGVKYNIVLEFYDNTGQAVSQLSWSYPSQVSQIIPTTQLYSAVSSCGSPASTNVVINAQPATPAIPTIGTITQPDCVTATGSVVLSGLPASGTINQTGTATNSYPITGSTMTISGLSAGTYNFTASSGTCTSSPSVNVDINTSVPNTWNGTAWSGGTPNTNAFSNQALVFNGNYPSSTDDLFGCSCTVNTAFAVTVKTGRTMTITNGVTVQTGGTLTFENNASLVQINDAAINTGIITYDRNTTYVYPEDYTYWSSPVAGYTLGGVSQNLTLSNMYYSYDSTIDDWQKASAATAMTPGFGYIIGGPKFTGTGAPTIFNAYFIGTPNNGIINAPIGAVDTSNLLGNPYPSAINADKFLAFNSGVLDGTIYFWTHNTAMQDRNLIGNNPDGSTKAGSGAYAYTQDDYASYNITGGVGTAPDITAAAINPGGNMNKPSGKIAAGQAFFTTSVAAGNAIFNNSMRLDNGNNTLDNSQFFKTSNTKGKTTNAVEKNRIWLDLSNSQGAFKQTLVGYVTGATNEYDTVFDGESFDGNEFVDFYSVLQDMNLTIQGRALPFNENDVVPLGFKSTINGNFTINIDQADGLLTNQAVYIEDKLTNTTADLKSGSYTFTTVSGTFNDRFVLHYTNKTLGTTDFESQANTVLVSIKNKQIKINSFAETIDKVTIFDLLGRQIYQKDKVNSNEFLASEFVSSHQALIVKATLQNGKTVTEKIIY